MSNGDFEKQRQNALNQMREMNARSTSTPLPKTKISPPAPQQGSPFGGLNLELPFENLFKDKETALILSLLLILYGEKADKMLLLALVYILL